MSEKKKVFNFQIKDSEELMSLMEGLSELNADIDAESTPSSIEISVYGSVEKIEKASRKIFDLVKRSRSA